MPDAVRGRRRTRCAARLRSGARPVAGRARPEARKPRAPEANLLIAHIYERQKRLDAATAKYTEVKNRYPTNPVSAEALVRLADLVQQTKDSNRVQTARQYLTDAVTQFPDVAIAPQALSMRAGIEERENIKVTDATLGSPVPAALVSYRQLSERYPTAGVSSSRSGSSPRSTRISERYDLAAEALGTLGTRFPATRYDAWWEAGELYDKRLKDKDKAKDAYSKVPSTSRRYKDAQKKAQQGRHLRRHETSSRHRRRHGRHARARDRRAGPYRRVGDERARAVRLAADRLGRAGPARLVARDGRGRAGRDREGRRRRRSRPSASPARCTAPSLLDDVGRGRASGAALVRPADGRRVPRNHRAHRRGAADRADAEPGADGVHAAEAAVGAQARARQVEDACARCCCRRTTCASA